MGIVGKPDSEDVQFRKMLKPKLNLLDESCLSEVVPDLEAVAAPTGLIIETPHPGVFMNA